MRVCIVSDHEATSLVIREILNRQMPECLALPAMSFRAAAGGLVTAQPDAVIVVLNPDPEFALAVLKDLHPQTRAAMLAVGPAADSRLILRTLHAGANDYVDTAELATSMVDALTRLRASLPGQAEPGKIIAVLAPNGGSGSSTLAVNVAAALAKQHQKTVLFDLKLETGDLAPLLDLKPAYTLADLCQNTARMDAVMFEGCLARHSSGVHLLAPPRSFADIAYIKPEGVRQALLLARALFPYVVVDQDHSFREEQLLVLRQADVILIVIRLDFVSLRNAQRTLAYLTGLGIAPDRLRLVVNRFGQPQEVPAAKVEEALNMRIFHYVPDDPKTINRANNNGVPAVLESPSARVSRSVIQLAVNINGRHKSG